MTNDRSLREDTHVPGHGKPGVDVGQERHALSANLARLGKLLVHEPPDNGAPDFLVDLISQAKMEKKRNG